MSSWTTFRSRHVAAGSGRRYEKVLVVLEGDVLVKALRETGLILGDLSRPCLDVEKLELFFLRHAAVLLGHLAAM